MKHAGPDALVKLSPLIAKLRARPLLREKRPGVFYLKSRAFLHFHEDPKGFFADVRFDQDFERLAATSRSDQASLLTRIDERLSAVASSPPESKRKAKGARQ